MYKIDTKNMSEVIAEVLKTYGKDIFLQESRFRGAVMDCMGINMNSPEGRLLMFSSEIGFGRVFHTLFQEKYDWKRELSGFRQILFEQYGFQDSMIEKLIESYLLGIDKSGYYLNIYRGSKNNALLNNNTPIKNNIYSELTVNSESEESRYSYGLRYVFSNNNHPTRHRLKVHNLIKKGNPVPIIKRVEIKNVYEGTTGITLFIYKSDSTDEYYEPNNGSIISYLSISKLKDFKQGDWIHFNMSVNKIGQMEILATNNINKIFGKKVIHLS